VGFDDNNLIEWTYTTNGDKLRKTVLINGTISYTKDYMGGFKNEYPISNNQFPMMK